jgi:hypothetical protein
MQTVYAASDKGGDISAYFNARDSCIIVQKSVRKIYSNCTEICKRAVLDGTMGEHKRLQI